MEERLRRLERNMRESGLKSDSLAFLNALQQSGNGLESHLEGEICKAANNIKFFLLLEAERVLGYDNFEERLFGDSTLEHDHSGEQEYHSSTGPCTRCYPINPKKVLRIASNWGHTMGKGYRMHEGFGHPEEDGRSEFGLYLVPEKGLIVYAERLFRGRFELEEGQELRDELFHYKDWSTGKEIMKNYFNYYALTIEAIQTQKEKIEDQV